jgi:orotate phosphoribosyltransferase
MDPIISLFIKCGALYAPTHVVLTPKEGNPFPHSDLYLNKDAVTMYPLLGDRLYKAMVKPWLKEGIEVVVSPATAGIPIAQGMAREFGSHLHDEMFPAVYAELRDPGDKQSGLQLKRGFDRVVKGKRILVGEDITTKGRSAKETVKAAEAAGGIVVGVAVIVDRGGVTAEDLGVERMECLSKLSGYDAHVWRQEECPRCQNKVALEVGVGHGAKWLETELGKAWLAAGGTIA